MLTHFIGKGVTWKQGVLGGESSSAVDWVFWFFFLNISCEIVTEILACVT